MRTIKVYGLFIVVSFLLLLLMINLPLATSNGNGGIVSVDYVAGMTTTINNILRHANTISSFGGRVTGYNGSYAVANYIYQQLKSFGNLLVTKQPYKLVVPVDEGSSVSIISGNGSVETYPAYAVWPNGPQTSPTPQEGVSGLGIYLGDGSLESMDGKSIKGSIVILNYNSGDNWLNAAKFGAKAAVIIAPSEESTSSEALRKVVDAPLYFPRVVVSRSVGSRLIEAAKEGLQIKVVSRMNYEEVVAYNIVAFKRCSESPETLILSTYYDSWSIAPHFANSTYEALQVGYLLELAKLMSHENYTRNIMFVFFSGHWQALSGSREFVESYYFNKTITLGNVTFNWKPVMMINIGNLDPGGIGVQLLRGSDLSGYATTSGSSGITLRYSWVMSKIFNDYLLHKDFVDSFKLLTQVDPSTLVRQFFTNTMYWGTEPMPYMLDSEPAEQTRQVAFTIQSSFTNKLWLFSPYNPPLLLNSQGRLNLEVQVSLINQIVISFALEKSWGIDWSTTSPTRLYITVGGVSQFSGFVTLVGKVVTYNLSKGWYTPVSGAIVRVYIGQMNPYVSPYPYPFNKIVTFSDTNGTFIIHGLAPYPFIPSGQYVIDAWVIDQDNGRIEYAPDYGIYGAKVFPPSVAPFASYEKATISIMPCYSVTLFDLIDPWSGRPLLIPDPRPFSYGIGTGWFFIQGGILIPQDFNTRGDPLFYGVYFNQFEPIGLVFLLPKTRGAVILKMGGLATPVGNWPSMVFVNASVEYPEGTGFYSDGEPIVLTMSSFRYAIDLYFLSYTRYKSLSERGARNLNLEYQLNETKKYLKLAEDALNNKDYGNFERYSLVAWAWASRTYESLMPFIDDSGKSSIFFMLLLIPSAIFLEKLVLHTEGKRRIVTTLFFGALLIFVFSLVHPALQVMKNSVMAIFGLLTIPLVLLVIFILFSETDKILKEISTRILGYHTTETSKLDIIATSYSTAIENMRKRKLRATLTLTTIIVTALAVTALSSVSTTIVIEKIPVSYSNYTSYEILLKSGFALPPNQILSPRTVDLLKGFLRNTSNTVFPRAWYYPTSIGPNTGVVTFIRKWDAPIGSPNASINAFLGITPKDSELLLNQSLLEGAPFSNNDYFACIIPEEVAKSLNISVGDYISILGLKLVVKGIYTSNRLNTLRNIDNSFITPINPLYVGSLGTGYVIPSTLTPPSLSWSNIIIVPYRLAIDLGGYVAEVSVVFPEGTSPFFVENVASMLASVSSVPVYLKSGNKVFALSRIQSFAIRGFEGVFIAVIIGALNITSAFLGNTKERTKELYTYSAVGLSPLGAVAMFVTEAVVYALIGIIIGYLLGFLFNAVFIKFNLLPSTYAFNYASIFLVISLSVLIASALVSSAYPSKVAAQLITPSLERKWQPPTKPRGTTWEVPLPISFSNPKEALGFLEFLYEYYSGAGYEKPIFRVQSFENISYKDYLIAIQIALAPYELQTVQRVNIKGMMSRTENKISFFVKMDMLSGDKDIWVTRAYYFLDDLRKQVLLWRALPFSEREKYVQKVGG
ncbi:MAG: FtsX-like permease family protein [Thermoproteota archaeon]